MLKSIVDVQNVIASVVKPEVTSFIPTGYIPNIVAEATIDNNIGTPIVVVTNVGTSKEPKLLFEFKNLKGEAGSTGQDKAILTAAGWTNKKQELPIEGLTVESNVTIYPQDSSAAAYVLAGLTVTQVAGALLFTCTSVPTVDISIIIEYTASENGGSQPSEPTDPDTPSEPTNSIQGGWRWNTQIVYTKDLEAVFNFVSDGIAYSRLQRTNSSNSLAYYNDEDGYLTVYSNGKWVGTTDVSDKRRTIEILSKTSTDINGQDNTDEVFTCLNLSAIKLDEETTDPAIITFNIAGTTYQAKEGMTWEKWINSEYNTDGLYIDAEYHIRSANNETVVWYFIEESVLRYSTYSESIDASINYYLAEKSLPEPTQITFTVDGESYQAESGMTWFEFIESSYNTDSVFAIEVVEFELTGERYSVVTYHGSFVTFTNDSGYSVTANGEYIIDSSKNYKTH